MKPDLKFKSHMEFDKLVIDGKRYGTDDLDKLPQAISPINVSTKSNDKVSASLVSFALLAISIQLTSSTKVKAIIAANSSSNMQRYSTSMIKKQRNGS